jgi:ABC-type hemin transport system ATPase subunit
VYVCVCVRARSVSVAAVCVSVGLHALGATAQVVNTISLVQRGLVSAAHRLSINTCEKLNLTRGFVQAVHVSRQPRNHVPVRGELVSQTVVRVLRRLGCTGVCDC